MKTSDDFLAFYASRLEEYTNQLDKVQAKIRNISNLRIALAIGILVSIYFAFTIDQLFVPILLLIGCFIFLVRMHNASFEEKERLEKMVTLNKAEWNALQGDYSFFNSGSTYIDAHHTYAFDLDLFGETSLFQYLNRCATDGGREKLATLLKEYPHDPDTIERLQRAIQELSPQHPLRQELYVTGALMKEEASDRIAIASWIRHPPFLLPLKWLPLMLWLLPTATVSMVVIAFFMATLKPVALGLIAAQWFVLGRNAKKILVFQDFIGKKKNILVRYAAFIRRIAQADFKSSLLREQQEVARESGDRIETLSKMVELLDARMNIFFNILANSLFMHDLRMVYKLEKWKEQNGSSLVRWLEVIYRMEVLNCFSTFAFHHPAYCYARVAAPLQFKARNLGHPLIPEEVRVNNSITMDATASCVTITGANMAGKSTFLRTLGVNLILAFNGAPVAAEEFSCSPMHLWTGMRTADSLKDNESYFYAELSRLKRIISNLREGKHAMILLDEILKGTNSNDKLLGSIAIVKQLLGFSCLAVVATHDLGLGALEKTYPGRIRNYCFEPEIQNNQLHFDYQLKKGLAQKMNATFLMKQMGIIPE